MTRFSCLFLASLVASSTAFSVFPNTQTGRVSDTSLSLFGNLGDAFKNDDKLATPQSAGLKGVSVVL
jgi:hypothetical protein